MVGRRNRPVSRTIRVAGLLSLGAASLALAASLTQAGCGTPATISSTGGSGGTGGSTSGTNTGGGPGACTPAKDQQELSEPEVRKSDKGVLTTTLKAAGDTTQTCLISNKGADGKAAWPGVPRLFSLSRYEGMLPGPTLELHVPKPGVMPKVNGDVLSLTNENGGQLDVCCSCNDASGMAIAKCTVPMYCMEVQVPDGTCIRVDEATNMHTHGFHIGPGFGSVDACPDNVSANGPPWDNVFLEVPYKPGGTQGCGPTCGQNNPQPYVYPLPPQQMTDVFMPAPIDDPHWFGLQWYHPHMHGVTADQVGRGLAGAIIVRNDIENDIPVLKNSAERLLVLQRPATDDQPSSARSQSYLVNGLTNPIMSIAPGETQRWRIANASEGSRITFSVNGPDGKPVTFYPIGFDGVPLPAVGAGVTASAMGPGNRVEILVRAPKDAVGPYSVRWCEPDSTGSCSGTTAVNVTVATVTVKGAAMDPSPADLPGVPLVTVDKFGLTPNLWEAGLPQPKKHTVKFQNGTPGMVWLIDDVAFPDTDKPDMTQECSPPVTVTQSSTEEWTVENYTCAYHTFHIHVNPFQVSPAAGQTPFYQDTVLIPPTTGCPTDGTNNNNSSTFTSTTFRMTFKDYPGLSVFHCHMLAHEDGGMMAAFQINP
jgi:FtsP/CotA-like multicopper oxidase with cupredoxin domain